MYRWIRRNYRLTKDQRERGVRFSSAFYVPEWGETEEGTIHEVLRDDPDGSRQIGLLRDRTSRRMFQSMARDLGVTAYEVVRS